MFSPASKSALHKIRERRLRANIQQQSRVTAVFDDHAQSFTMRASATLGELSERLALVAARQGGWPASVNIKFGAAARHSPPVPVGHRAASPPPRYVM